MKLEKEDIKNIQNSIFEVAKPYVEVDIQNEFMKHIDEKLEKFNPTMMVYGVYNAGKSSLINALFGKEELAKTSDVPQTDDITPYKFGGYTIYDTPGINAPIEHQEVTEEHLKKCELVLFVMSNVGSFEDRYIYEKIAEVLENKKPILIVLNNKSGININSEDAIREINTINKHLSSICDEKGIKEAEKKVDVIFVNTKLALLGKLKNQEKVIELSNIINVENKINDILSSSNSEEVIRTLALYMSEYINSTLIKIDEQISDYHSKNIEGLITFIEKLKQTVLIDIQNSISQTTTIILGNLMTFFLQRNSNDEIKKMITDLTEKLRVEINLIWEKAYNKIKYKLNEFEEEFSKVSLDVEFEDIKADLKSQKSTFENEDTLFSETTVTSIGALINTVPPFHPFVTPIKVILNIVLSIYSTFSSSSEAKAQAMAELEEKRAYHLAAKNQADSFVISYKNNINQEIQKSIIAKFDNLIKKYRIISERLSQEDKILKSDKKELEKINSNLLSNI